MIEANRPSARWAGSGHLGVERREHGGRVRVHRHQGAPAEAQPGGLGGGRRAVAGHVAHHHRQPPVGQHRGVVEVAAHQQRPLGRLVAGGQAQAAHARQALGQQAALDRLPQLPLGALGRLAAGGGGDGVALALHLALHEVEPLHQLGELAHRVPARWDGVGQAAARDAPDALAEQRDRPAHPAPELAADHRDHHEGQQGRGADRGEGQQAAAVVRGQRVDARLLDLLQQLGVLAAEGGEARLAEALVDAPDGLLLAALAAQADELDGLGEPELGGAVDRLGRLLERRPAAQPLAQLGHRGRVAVARRLVLGEVVAARQQDVGAVGALGAEQVREQLVGDLLARARELAAAAVVARRAQDPDDRDRDQHPEHHREPRHEAGEHPAQRPRAPAAPQPHPLAALRKAAPPAPGG